jgi:hypothetical protein
VATPSPVEKYSRRLTEFLLSTYQDALVTEELERCGTGSFYKSLDRRL